MFKRKDWVHSKKGRGGGLEDSSSSGSSSSSDDDSGSEDGGERLELQGPPSSDDEKNDSDDEKSDSEESSGSEELDAEDLAALRDDDDDVDEQVRVDVQEESDGLSNRSRGIDIGLLDRRRVGQETDRRSTDEPAEQGSSGVGQQIVDVGESIGAGRQAPQARSLGQLDRQGNH